MTARRPGWLLSSLTLALLSVTVVAWSYWSAPGVGSASAATANLAAATITTPPSAANAIAVTWTSQASLQPGSAANSAITYHVQRRLGAGSYAAVSSGGCSGAKPYGTSSCADVPPATATYGYRVVATFRSWTATSADSGAVAFLLDATAPTAVSIVRADSSPANSGSVSWTVTFSEPVTGVGADDFLLARTGGLTGGSISGVAGSGTTYVVTASTGSGDGTLGLILVDDDTIVDAAANALGGGGAGNGNLAGEAYTIDRTPPTVSSIVRLGTTPTNVGSVQWTVTFSEPVTGVGTADFVLANAGLTAGPSISSVSGSAGAYTVTATTGGGDGTLGLNLVDDDTIIDAATNRLGGTGAANGNFAGQTYTLDRTPPAAPASATVDNGVAPNASECSVAASTRYVNNAGKGAVTVTATFAATPNPGDAFVFSISTPGSTPLSATVASSPPAMSVSTTLNLGSLLDGTVTMTVSTKDLAGNLSTTSRSPVNVVIKDTVAPLTAVYSVILVVNGRVTGNAECGAFISALRVPGGANFTGRIGSGSFYDIGVGLLSLGRVFDVTSTDLAGNLSAVVRTS